MKIIAVVNGNQEQEDNQEEIGNISIKPNLIGELIHNYQPNHPHHQPNHHHSLKEKDERFIQLQEIIEQKKHYLLANQKKLKKISKQNEFLEHIKNDYFKYNDYVVKQKNDQMKALELLNEYIHDLSNSGELSEQNIKDSRHEQRKIMKEIKDIKSSLDSLIEGEESQINNLRNIGNQ
jgi:hypothetical protein